MDGEIHKEAVRKEQTGVAGHEYVTFIHVEICGCETVKQGCAPGSCIY